MRRELPIRGFLLCQFRGLSRSGDLGRGAAKAERSAAVWTLVRDDMPLAGDLGDFVCRCAREVGVYST